MPDIHTMKLHEEVIQGNLKIVRVPGGWLYVVKFYDAVNAEFVPYSDDFNPLVRKGYRSGMQIGKETKNATLSTD